MMATLIFFIKKQYMKAYGGCQSLCKAFGFCYTDEFAPRARDRGTVLIKIKEGTDFAHTGDPKKQAEKGPAGLVSGADLPVDLPFPERFLFHAPGVDAH
jgi:hypothetical protein